MKKIYTTPQLLFHSTLSEFFLENFVKGSKEAGSGTGAGDVSGNGDGLAKDRSNMNFYQDYSDSEW